MYYIFIIMMSIFEVIIIHIKNTNKSLTCKHSFWLSNFIVVLIFKIANRERKQ